MKKKYRVTTRGKFVFSLAGLLLIYGLFVLLSPTPIQPTDPIEQVEETVGVKDETVQTENSEIQTDVGAENTADVEEQPSSEEMSPSLDITEEGGDSIKIENCTTNKTFTSENELKLLEAAGFTVYYEPNAYYVPEGDLALIAEFVSVAKAYPEEQIIIEGNVNKSVGPEDEWDTEDVDQLGYTRGLVIKNDLIKRGIDKERIIIYNNKDEKHLHVDLSGKSIALNRRVDVFFSQFMYDEIDIK